MIFSDKDFKIPKSFKLMGKTIKVIFDPLLVDQHRCDGMVDYSKELIILQPSTSGRPASEQGIEQVFYHELVHYLFYLTEDDASDDRLLHTRECLIERFSSLLQQAINTMKY